MTAFAEQAADKPIAVKSRQSGVTFETGYAEDVPLLLAPGVQ